MDHVSPESHERSSNGSELLSDQFQILKSSVVQDVYQAARIYIHLLNDLVISENFDHESFVVIGDSRNGVAGAVRNRFGQPGTSLDWAKAGLTVSPLPGVLTIFFRRTTLDGVDDPTVFRP